MDQRSERHRAAEFDPDLAGQARPGHGVPSQDPDAAAQYAIEADRAIEERRTVFVGAGVMAGAAAGAAVGAAAAGPVGVVLGGTFGAFAGAFLGAIAGAFGGAAAALPKAS